MVLFEATSIPSVPAIVGDRDGRVVRTAPGASGIDSLLAHVSGAVWRTASLCLGALRPEEVEGLVEDNDLRLVGGEELLELVDIGRYHGCSVAAARDVGGKTLACSAHAVGD